MPGEIKDYLSAWTKHAFSKIPTLPKEASKFDDTKLNKYFGAKNKKIAPLLRAAVGATQESKNICQDIHSSKYLRDTNTVSINATMQVFKDEGIAGSVGGNVVYRQLVEKFRKHLNNAGTSHNKIVSAAKKIIPKVSKESSEEHLWTLVNRKTIVSQEFAKLETKTRYNQKRLGFFGFLLHPMQTYRNNCTKKLIGEFRNVQYNARFLKNRYDPKKWQDTVSKFIIYGQLVNEKINNEKIGRCIEELARHYDILTQFEANNKLGVNHDLVKMIHNAIEKLMSITADVTLQAEARVPKNAPN